MPELPDVEILKRYCDATVLHKSIDKVEVQSKRVVEGVSPDELDNTLQGKRFESTDRHGKHLFIQLDHQDWLVLHFGMTGDLKYYKEADAQPEFTQVLFSYANGYHLAYILPRKLGKIRLVDDKSQFIDDQELGPDALNDGLDFAAFADIMADRRGMAKSTLMNQQILAGIGNVYSDEILFQARIHPRMKLNQLDEDGFKRLYSKMKEVLRTAIDCQANLEQFPDSYLIPRRSEGEECPRCDGQVQRIEVSGRAGYFCPNCQKK